MRTTVKASGGEVNGSVDHVGERANESGDVETAIVDVAKVIVDVEKVIVVCKQTSVTMAPLVSVPAGAKQRRLQRVVKRE